MVALLKDENQRTLPIDQVIHGDCLSVLRTLPDNSVDAIVTDPPSGISFMGAAWDTFDGKKHRNGMQAKDKYSADGKWLEGRGTSPYGFGDTGINNNPKARNAFIAFMTEVMSEALRVLKPGGHALVWALPRTSHWTALALEDAGFEIRDCVYHVFGSGFPKSLDIGKAIDKLQGAEREVIGNNRKHNKIMRASGQNERPYQQGSDYIDIPVTAPATPEAQQWDGWGSALKPAVENWILVRKPISEKSIAENVLKHGTGGINVDGCRVGTEQTRTTIKDLSQAHGNQFGKPGITYPCLGYKENPPGRFPSHLLLSHSVFCTDDFCTENCPIRLLDEQSGIRKSGGMGKGVDTQTSWFGNGSHTPQNSHASEGGASRYFQQFSPDADDFVPYHYFSKSSRRERNAGCEELPLTDNSPRDFITGEWKVDKRSPDGGYPNNPSPPLQNTHPTVKSLSLMRWLCRLITPPGGIVLDPFAGSGSTGVACIKEGFHFIGIEQDESYIKIAEARIAYAQKEQPATQPTKEKKARSIQSTPALDNDTSELWETM